MRLGNLLGYGHGIPWYCGTSVRRKMLHALFYSILFNRYVCIDIGSSTLPVAYFQGTYRTGTGALSVPGTRCR